MPWLCVPKRSRLRQMRRSVCRHVKTVALARESDAHVVLLLPPSAPANPAERLVPDPAARRAPNLEVVALLDRPAANPEHADAPQSGISLGRS